MVSSQRTGKMYCSAKCWLPESERNNTQSAPEPQQQAITAKHDVVISRTEKPNSFEFGPANMRHKIYYEDIYDLKKRIKELVDNGLLDESNLNNFSST